MQVLLIISLKDIFISKSILRFINIFAFYENNVYIGLVN